MWHRKLFRLLYYFCTKIEYDRMSSSTSCNQRVAAREQFCHRSRLSCRGMASIRLAITKQRSRQFFEVDEHLHWHRRLTIDSNNEFSIDLFCFHSIAPVLRRFPASRRRIFRVHINSVVHFRQLSLHLSLSESLPGISWVRFSNV